MALTWDLTKIRDREVKYPADQEGRQNVVTYSLIWATLLTGIGEITETTAAEFYARIHAWEAMHGAFIHGKDEDTQEWVTMPITAEQVRDHIGLRTNVFPMETRAKWVKRMLSQRMDEYVAEYAKEASDGG